MLVRGQYRRPANIGQLPFVGSDKKCLTNMIGLGNLATWPDWTGGENSMKKLYEIREYGHKGSCYSRSIFRQLVSRQRALRIVKRLKRSGRDVKATPVMVSA